MEGTITAGRVLESRGELPARRDGSAHNVGTTERVISALVGGALTLRGLRRGGVSGLLLAAAGGMAVKRGVTGHCPAFAALGVDTAGDAR